MLAMILDPNQVLVVAGSVVVAIIGLIGVTIGQNKRLKIVDRKTDQLMTNGGYSVADGVYATRDNVDRINNEMVTMRDTVDKIFHNQTLGFSQAVNLIERIGAVTQAQATADMRQANFEHRMAKEMAQVKARIDVLAKRLVDPHLEPVPGEVIPKEPT